LPFVCLLAPAAAAAGSAGGVVSLDRAEVLRVAVGTSSTYVLFLFLCWSSVFFFFFAANSSQLADSHLLLLFIISRRARSSAPTLYCWYIQ
jgi:hypothetical protein